MTTFHHALLYASTNWYADRQDVVVSKNGTIRDWSYAVTIGAIPEDIKQLMALTPGIYDAMLNGLIGAVRYSGTPQERIAQRDAAIEEKAAKFQFEAPWNDDRHIYTAVRVYRDVEVGTNENSNLTRHLWYDAAQAIQVQEEVTGDAAAAAHAVVASLLSGLDPSIMGTSWPRRLEWLATENKAPCPIPVFEAGAVGVVTQLNAGAIIEQSEQMPDLSGLRKDQLEKLAQIGRWHAAAISEKDDFRRFLWLYAGLEVVARYAGRAARRALPDLLMRDNVSSIPLGPALRELFWPVDDTGREPNRGIVSDFSAMAILLSPSTAVEDIDTFRQVSRFRNNIHGSAFNPRDAPVDQLSTLWRRYAVLAGRFVVDA